MGVLADILRQHGSAYLEAAGGAVPAAQRRAVRRVTACRSGRLGGHAEVCGDCGGLVRFTPHSCRDRLCPVCRGPEAHAWLRARQADVLPVLYFHVVLTVPSVYSLAVRDRPQRLGSELLEAAAEALQEVARGPHGPGGELGILAVLHTWGRNLGWHAHVHCLVPGVVLCADGTFRTIRTRFLAPIRALRSVFRAVLTRRYRRALQGFDPPGRVWRTAWNVYIRPCDDGPRTVLNYLARYVRSGPLHEKQIRQADDAQVAFRYLDHRSRTVQTWRGTPATFVARYLQHALPHGFHRIRHYGFYAPGRRRDLRALQVAMLAQCDGRTLAPAAVPEPTAPEPCPHCGSKRSRWHVYIPPRREAIVFAVTWRAPPPALP